VLTDNHSVVIVGCSDNPYRASNHAATVLVDAGYSVVPVNPKYELVNGLTCYPDFQDVPDDVEIDIVNVFRNPSHTASLVKAVVERTARIGGKPVIWTQPGVSSPEAEEAAARAGLEYVQNRCIMAELAILTGNSS
jgi:predicted CoA-binding protein